MTSKQAHWQSIYNTKDHQKVGWYQEVPKISLDLLNKIKADPTQSIIDVGCGASFLVDYLIKANFTKITLVDLSITALETIKKRLTIKGNIPIYLSADITQVVLEQSYDIWHDRAVFHFLVEKVDRQNYMDQLAKYLAPNGHAIIGTFSPNGPISCSGLEIVQYNKDKMETELPHSLKLEYSITDLNITPNGNEQEYNYFIIKKVK